MYKGVFLFQIFICSTLFAGNGIITAAVNQHRLGTICGMVNEKSELKKFGFACSPEKQNYLKRSRIEVTPILNHVVFTDAAKKQIPKDKCLVEALTSIRNDPKQLDIWQTMTIASWVKYRKAKLMAKKCQDLFYTSLGNRLKTTQGLEWAKKYFKPVYSGSTATLNSWKNICLNEKYYPGLKQVDALFAETLPIVNSSEIWKTVEKNREFIVDKKTGKMITDQDLMQLDLRNLSGLKIEDPVKTGPRTGFTSIRTELNGFMKSFIKNKKDVTDRLALATKNDEPLSQPLRDYLYEQGTVTDSLVESGMMTLDENNKVISMSSGAACIRAWNEPNIAGDLLEFAATSLVSGSIIYKGLGSLPKFSKISNMEKAGKALSWGTVLGSVPLAGKPIYKKCLSMAARSAKMKTTIDNDIRQELEGNNLPESISYQRLNSKISAQEIPSCESGEAGNYIANWSTNAQCMSEVASDILPLAISLPLSALAEF